MSEFYKNKAYTNGYYTFCIDCYKKKQKTFKPSEININYSDSDLEKEIWKTLVINGENFPYIISNCGRIIRKKSTGDFFVKYSYDNRGYPQLVVYGNSKRISRRIHRLVAENFIENEFKKAQVNHIDGDKLNNNVKNLEWCTNQENIDHANKLGLRENCYIK